MASVFISYRRKDFERLQPLLLALDAEGLQYWLDKREVEAFADFSNAVVAALSDAQGSPGVVLP